jgi:hypothetical protein
MWDTVDPRSETRDRGLEESRDLGQSDPRDVFVSGVDLPRGLERELVRDGDETYQLRGSEVRTLATIGTFRVVPVKDLRDERGRPLDPWHGDLERLRATGLVRTVAPMSRHGKERTVVVALTQRGRHLLEHNRKAEHDVRQSFYADVVKPRELAHDAQLFRAYLRTAERLRDEGARVRRVVLDYELKREYQSFLQARNREQPDSDGRPTRTPDEIREWAEQHELPQMDGRVQFPDFRIEYERPDGRREVEDVEVMTPHYRGAHAAAKARAGFTQVRSGGSRIGGRTRGGGGRSPDPRLAEEFLD